MLYYLNFVHWGLRIMKSGLITKQHKTNIYSHTHNLCLIMHILGEMGCIFIINLVSVILEDVLVYSTDFTLFYTWF